MNGKYQNSIVERLLDYAVNVIKLAGKLPKSALGSHINGQLTRSGTSAGSNYEEACGAESRADFIHKMGIVLKELKESRYWLKLINRSGIIKDDNMPALINETEELCKIIAQSIITAKSKI
jgi:four helix bundle protein